MRHGNHTITATIITIIFIIFGLVLALRVTPIETAEKVLQDNGIKKPIIGDPKYMRCGSGDKVGRSFAGYNSNGRFVEGVVCCGQVMKNCTVRFDSD